MTLTKPPQPTEAPERSDSGRKLFKGCKFTSRKMFLAMGTAALGALVLTLTSLAPPLRTAEAATPSGGQTIVGQSVVCPNFDSGTGFLINQNNVTLVNPRVVDCGVGVLIARKTDGSLPSNVRIVADPTRPGYERSGIYHTRTAVRAKGFDGLEIGGVNGGILTFRENYRGIEMEGGINANIHHNDVLGPSYVFPGANNGDKGAIVGIKALALPSLGAPYEMKDIDVHHNKVANVFEEGISFDPRSGDPQEALPKEGDVVAGRSTTSSTITLSDDAFNNAGNKYGGYKVFFTSGKANGEYLHISKQQNKTLYVQDSNNVLSDVATGDRLGIGFVYHHLSVRNNEVNATGGRVGIAFGGMVFHSTIADNRISDYSDYDYPDVFNLRERSGVTVPQAIRVSSQGGVSRGGLAENARRAPSAHISVVNNTADGDITLSNTTYGGDAYSTPNHYSGNSFSSATGQLWTYNQFRMAAPPA